MGQIFTHSFNARKSVQWLFKSIDKIAERITTIGGKAPGDFKSYQKMQIVKDANENLAPQDMLDDLMKSNDQMVIF